MEKTFLLEEYVKAMDADLLAPDPAAAGQLEITEVSTDSRTIKAGGLFIALIGERTDGHLYLDKAAARGASALVVSDRAAGELWGAKLPVLVVKDTAQALGTAARLYREKVNPNLIAISGSVGKTSTRDMVAAALSASDRVHKTADNLNNVFGVPYTILAMPGDCETAVIECGMDRKGKLRQSSKTAAPDIVMLTNIGTSHIENIGSRRGILEAKTELTESMRPGGALVLNGEDPFLLDLAEQKAGECPLYFVTSLGLTSFLQTPLSAEDKSQTKGGGRERLQALARRAAEYQGPRRYKNLPPGSIIEIYDVKISRAGLAARLRLRLPEGELKELAPVKLPKPALQQAANILYAAAALLLLGRPLQAGLAALQHVNLTSGRQELIPLREGGLLIDDCYNASPESMKAAFALCEALLKEDAYDEVVAVLGGVKELGEYAASLHELIGEAAGRTAFSSYYLLGDYANNLAAGIRKSRAEADIHTFAAQEDLLKALEPRLRPNSLYLVKASRGYALEHSCRLIRRVLGEPAEAEPQA